MFIVAFIHAECTIQEQMKKKEDTARLIHFWNQTFCSSEQFPAFMAVKAEAEAAQAKFVRETRAARILV